jgi:hypothetical protein
MDSKYQELSKATSIEEVVRLTRDFLRSWSHQDLDRLPDGYRSLVVKGPEDIELWADRLAGAAGKAALFLDDERKLDRLTSHFLIASVRIRQITGAFA